MPSRNARPAKSAPTSLIGRVVQPRFYTKGGFAYGVITRELGSAKIEVRWDDQETAEVLLRSQVDTCIDLKGRPAYRPLP